MHRPASKLYQRDRHSQTYPHLRTTALDSETGVRILLLLGMVSTVLRSSGRKSPMVICLRGRRARRSAPPSPPSATLVPAMLAPPALRTPGTTASHVVVADRAVGGNRLESDMVGSRELLWHDGAGRYKTPPGEPLCESAVGTHGFQQSALSMSALLNTMSAEV